MLNLRESETVGRCRDHVALLLDVCNSCLELEGKALDGAAHVLLGVMLELDGLLKIGGANGEKEN